MIDKSILYSEDDYIHRGELNEYDFFYALGYNLNDKIYFRTFTDDKSKLQEDQRGGDGRNYDAFLGEHDGLFKELHRQNDADPGRGVFFVVNGGGQNDRAVTRARAQFIDMDDGALDEQLEKINAFPLEPSIVIQTKKSLHAYWILDDDATIERWAPLQLRLINYFGSDPTIKNPSRVMRVPGFYHCKQEPRVMVKWIHFNGKKRYSQRELDAALPILPASDQIQRTTAASGPAPSTSGTWGTDPGYITRDDMCTWVENWAKQFDVAISGRHVDASGAAVFDVVCPWAAEHSADSGNRQTAILVKPDGKIGYKCFHSHCADRTWKEYRDTIEADYFGEEQIQITGNGTEETPAAAETPAKEREDPLSRFEKKIQTEAYKPFATGQSFFDNLLSGGIDPQTLLVLMAAPGTGKTALAQQIAEGIAARRHYVIYLNLEMPIEQMYARAISARLCQHDGRAVTEFSPTKILRGYEWTGDPERSKIITDEIEKYRQSTYPFIRYLTYTETGNYIEDILQTLRTAGKKTMEAGAKSGPFVVVDYMHLIKSKDSHKDTAQLLMDIVKGLKDYATEFNTSVLVISATNRQSNKGGIDDSSARDSSNIEYTGDYVVSLNYWAVDEGIVKPAHQNRFDVIKMQRVRQMKLRVHKCRGGIVGKTANVYFFPAGNFFFSEFDFFPAYLSNDVMSFSRQTVKEYVDFRAELPTSTTTATNK